MGHEFSKQWGCVPQNTNYTYLFAQDTLFVTKNNPEPEKPVQAGGPDPTAGRSLTRAEVADWLVANSRTILRRIRRKTRRAGEAAGPFAATILDEDDILASVSRRIDAAAADGSLRTTHQAELWAYVRAITRNVVHQRLREGARDARLFATLTDAEERQVRNAAQAELDRLAPWLRNMLSDEEWCQVVLRARGAEGRSVAAAAGVSEPSQRKQWSRLLATLRAALRRSPPSKQDRDGH